LEFAKLQGVIAMIRSYLVFFCLSAAACWANAVSLQPQEGSLSERGATEHVERAHELQEFKLERSVDNDAGAARGLYPNLVRNMHGSSSNSKLKTSNDYLHRVLLRKGGHVEPGVTPFVKIRGPFDSGTNFLHQLLKKNGIFEHSADYGQEETAEDLGGWKHWPLQWEPADMEKPNRFRILVARHPLAWFLSNERTPYDIKCNDFHGSSECTFELYHILDKCSNPVIRDKLQGRGFVKFDNIMEIWNMYYKGYLETEFPSLIVRYEDLLADPEAVVERIAQETGQKIDNSSVKVFKDQAKTIGRNFEEAKEYNLKKMFLAKYEIAEIPNILEYIDQDVLAQLGYSISMEEIENAIKASELEQQAAEQEGEEAKAGAEQQEKAATGAEEKVAEEKAVQNAEVKEENAAEAMHVATAEEAQQKEDQRRAQLKLEVQKQALEARAEKRKKEAEAMQAAIDAQKEEAERQQRGAKIFQDNENRAAHRYRSKSLKDSAVKKISKEKAAADKIADAATATRGSKEAAEAARIAEDDMEAKQAQAAAIAAMQGKVVEAATIAAEEMEAKEAAQAAATAAMEAKEAADKIAEEKREVEAAQAVANTAAEKAKEAADKIAEERRKVEAAQAAAIAAMEAKEAVDKIAEEERKAEAARAAAAAAAEKAKQAEVARKWRESVDEQVESTGADLKASIPQPNETIRQQLSDSMATVKKMKAAQQVATAKVIAEAVAAKAENVATLKTKVERKQEIIDARQKTEDLIAEKRAKRQAVLHAAAEAAKASRK